MSLVLAVLLIVVLVHFSKSKTVAEPQVSSTSDTLYLIDTSKHTTIKNNFYHTSVYNGTPNGAIDTEAIMKIYFTKQFIADTLNDSLLRLIISDTLYKNNLIYRKKQYEFLKPYQTKINTTQTFTVQQHGFYLGPCFGFNNSLQSAGMEANYVTPKINYGLGYDFKNNAITGKLLVRISKK